LSDPNIARLVYSSAVSGFVIGLNQLSLRLDTVQPAGLIGIGLLALTARRRTDTKRRGPPQP
jgi:hypothetical protein